MKRLRKLFRLPCTHNKMSYIRYNPEIVTFYDDGSPPSYFYSSSNATWFWRGCDKDKADAKICDNYSCSYVEWLR